MSKMKNISITDAESLSAENFNKFFISRDATKGNSCL